MGVDGLNLKQTISIDAINALLFEAGDPDFCFKSRELALLTCFLERENDHAFRVSIKADLKLYSQCGMCLEPLDIPCHLDFSILMIEGEEVLLPEIDGAELMSDPSVGYFSGRCIDLGLILRDQIFLQMPDYPQCESQGLTPCNKSLLLESESVSVKNPFVKFFKKE